MRVSCVARAPGVKVVELSRETAEDLRCPVGGEMVDGVDAIAESRDVPDRLLDEDVLVPDEDDPDDLHG